MNNQSLWEKISTRTLDYPALKEDMEIDVVVIGGGITGITAAHRLIKSGKKIAVIEAYKIGGVTTGYSTGNLYIPVQPFYQTIVDKFNLETARIIAHSRQFAINYIEKIIEENKISCNFFRRDWYGYSLDNPRINIEKEVELFKKMGIPIEYTKELPLPFKFKKAFHLPNQARFDPLQYVISLAENLKKLGCHLFENTRVTDFHEKKDVCIVTTDHAKITAKKILIATHTPIGISSFQSFTAPYRSYVVAGKLKTTNCPDGHFWELDKPAHITSTHPEERDQNKPALIMVSGSHHKTGQDKNMRGHYQELENFLRQHLNITEISHQWSAQHYHAADNIPYIGLASRFAKHTYIATGFFADGLVYGTLAGMIMGDLVLEKNNPLETTYCSTRFKPFASAKFLAKENVNVLMQYLKDYILPLAKNYSDLKPGEGKIVKIHHKTCAVSRDKNNQLHAVSAVCTHMKCLVHWNNAEQTWDCPCHGSRFTQTGQVIEGPAKYDLKKIPL